MQKQWYINYDNHDNNNIIDHIMEKRGIINSREKINYLNPDPNNLHDPFIFSDMKKAVNLIFEAEKNSDKVMIYGDYDVDGITSISLLYSFLNDFFDLSIDYYIPSRIEEGYGLNKKAIDKISNEYNLLITVDCGITGHNELLEAKTNGLKTIVTDHHQPGDTLPEADAIINPKINNCSYPFSNLAGVGVAFKLCQALAIKQGIDPIDPQLFKYIELVTIGSVADIVPLKNENRILINEGLKKLPDTDFTGLEILLNQLGLAESKISAGHIGYIIAPPLNAAGRLLDASIGVKLFLENDKKRLTEISNKLIKLNKDRQAEERKTYEEAIKKIEKEIDLNKNGAIILASTKWHEGVIGIVASRIVEKYYRPTILIAINDQGIGKGSGRSIKNLNLFQALKSVSDYLKNFGGHSQAAGLTIQENSINNFKKAFNNYLQSKLTNEDYIPGLKIDNVLTEKQLTKNLYNDVEQMAPFGIANPRPVFTLLNTNISQSYLVGKNNKHLKIKLSNGLEAIGFNMAKFKDLLNIYQNVDLAFNLTINRWKGKEKLELKLKDINIRQDKNRYPLLYITDQIRVADKRGCINKNNLLKSLVKSNDYNCVFAYDYFKKEINKSLKSHKQLEIISSIKDLNFYSPDNLILVSLPQSFKQLTNIINQLENMPTLYLIFNKNDYFKSREYIKKRFPTASLLRKFFQKLNEKPQNYILNKNIYSELEKTSLPLNKTFMKKSLNVFSELGLIKQEENGIKVLPLPSKKLDLSDSIRYNKIIRYISEFNSFCQFAYNDDLNIFIKKIHYNLKEDNYEFKEIH